MQQFDTCTTTLDDQLRTVEIYLKWRKIDGLQTNLRQGDLSQVQLCGTTTWHQVAVNQVSHTFSGVVAPKKNSWQITSQSFG